MTDTPDIKVRGLRSPIPSGYVLGRTDPGTGDAHLISISTLSDQVQATGQLAGSGSAQLADTAVTPGSYTSTNLTVSADGRITAAANGAGGGGGTTGLYGPLIVSTPTLAGTGLSTWLNQGSATRGDGTTGLWISLPAGTGQNIVSLTKAAPATPYKITALCALTSGGGDGTNNPAVGIGWTDGTQLHVIHYVVAGAVVPFVQVQKRTTSTASASNDLSSERAWPHPMWFQIGDDGTNVTFALSSDGVNFITVFSVAKASGFLGATGYSNVLFSVGGEANNDGLAKIGTLFYWKEA